MDAIVCTLGFALLGTGPFLLAAAATGQAPGADAILEKLESRIGEPAARAGVKGIVRKGRVEIGGMDAKGTFEETSLAADRTLLRVEFGGMGSSTQGTAGAASWSTDPALGVTVKEGDAGAAPRRLFAIGRRDPWKSMYARAELVGKKDLDGRSHFEIAMHPSSGKAETWFVDAETHDLARVDLALPNPTGGEIPMQFSFSDFRVVDGVRYPHRTVQRVEGMALAYVCESVRHEADLDPARVAPPPEVADAIRDKGKRTPEAKAGEYAVETVEPRRVASIRAVIDAREVSKHLAVLLPEVMKAIQEQGVSPAGPPFSRYHRIDEAKNEIDLEAGIFVSTSIREAGRVKSGVLPGGKAAMGWHVGPYSGLPKTYEALRRWMEGKSITPGEAFWEIYWTDPGVEPDPRQWKTQIWWPVAGGGR